jgi:hypothetical protein
MNLNKNREVRTEKGELSRSVSLPFDDFSSPCYPRGESSGQLADVGEAVALEQAGRDR